MVGAAFYLACHNHAEWSVRNLLERRPGKGKYAVFGARLYYIRIGFNGRAFQGLKFLIRSAPQFHMAPLLTTTDILST
jgi:hypothetical protein